MISFISVKRDGAAEVGSAPKVLSSTLGGFWCAHFRTLSRATALLDWIFADMPAGDRGTATEISPFTRYQLAK